MKINGCIIVHEFVSKTFLSHTTSCGCRAYTYNGIQKTRINLYILQLVGIMCDSRSFYMAI